MSTNPIDYGAQRLSFDYRSDARSALFNNIFFNLLPYGIYNGGTLTRISDTSIQIEPMTVIIPSNNGDSVAVKIDTTESQLVSLLTQGGSSCDESKPYIILRFGWAEEEENYMEIISSSFEDIEATDIILGKVNFEEIEGAYYVSESNPFDLSKRKNVSLSGIEQLKNSLKVSSTEPASGQVSISGGTIVTSKGSYSIAGSLFPVNGITPPSSGRIDIVGIDVNGQFVYKQGVDSADPVAPAYGNIKVLAEIHLSSGQSVINGSDIKIKDDFSVVQGMVAPEDTPIVDSDEHFPSAYRYLTAAIHYLWTHSLVLNRNSPEVTDYQIDVETNTDYPLGNLFI